MKFKLFKIFALSIGITAILFNGVFAQKKKAQTAFTMIDASQNSIKSVIFDLGDVLITHSRTQQTTMILALALRHPSLLYMLAKHDIKQELFNMLSNIPAHTNSDDQSMYNKGKLMPQIMVDWQTGRSCTDIYATALTYLATSNYPLNQKILYSKIIQLIFQPTQLIQALHPIQPMVKLAHALKAHGYKLYVLSNWDAESFPLLAEKHQNLFNLFDGTMISGAEGIGKPDPEFYQRLLQKYDLDPKECIFIDDEHHNITAACNLGIHGILHESMNATYIQLKNLGIIQAMEE